MRTLLMLVVWLMAWSMAITATAQVYSWHPSTFLRLGAGFDPANLSDSKESPVDSDGVDQTDVSSGTAKAEIQSRQIASYQDLLSVLKIDVDISAHYKIYSGKAELHDYEKTHFTSDSLTWFLQVTADYGRSRLKNPRLTQAAKNLVTKPEQFKNSFGTQFIVAERRAAIITAVFSINKLSQDKVSSLKTSLGLAVNNPIAGGKLNADYEKFFSEALKTSAMEFNLYTRGGQGLSTLSGIVTNLSNVTGIMETMSSYIAGVNANNAPPIEYQAQRISTLDNGLAFPELPTAYDETIEQYYFSYLRCQRTLEPLVALLENSSNKNCWIPVAKINELRAAKTKYQQLKIQLLKEAQEIKEGKREPSGTGPDIEFPDADLPYPRIVIMPPVWVGAWFWSGYVEGGAFTHVSLFSDEEERFKVRLATWQEHAEYCKASAKKAPPGLQAGWDYSVNSLKSILGPENLNSGSRKFFAVTLNGPFDVRKLSLRLLDCADGAVVTTSLTHL